MLLCEVILHSYNSPVLWESLPPFLLYTTLIGSENLAGVGVGIQNREPVWLRHTHLPSMPWSWLPSCFQNVSF